MCDEVNELDDVAREYPCIQEDVRCGMCTGCFRAWHSYMAYADVSPFSLVSNIPFLVSEMVSEDNTFLVESLLTYVGYSIRDEVFKLVDAINPIIALNTEEFWQESIEDVIFQHQAVMLRVYQTNLVKVDGKYYFRNWFSSNLFMGKA